MAERTTFTTIKKIKYLGIYLTRNAQTYSRKILRVLKRHKNRLEQVEIHSLFLDRTQQGKVLPKLLNKCDAISLKISTHFFMELDKLMLKFIWEKQSCKNSQEEKF